MKRRSLRLRLLSAAAVSIIVALIAAGFGWVQLFERHVERRLGVELETHLQQLAAGIVFDAQDQPHLKQAPADPRFSQPYGGLYWQVADENGIVMRSRSLWDAALALPADPLELGVLHEHEIDGPKGARLLVRERRLLYTTPAGKRTLRLAVALDRRELDRLTTDFASDLAPSLAILAGVLILAAWLQVSVGLRPLEAVRRSLNEVRSARRRRLEGDFPEEVTPLVGEVNELLEAQEQAIGRARAHAADLAHGLKTPLTVLAADAQRLRDRGEGEIAAELEDLADIMRRYVDRELARVRIGVRKGTGQTGTDVRAMAEPIVRTLQRTPRGGTLHWTVDITNAPKAAVDTEDMAELLGNLLDNACKWARGAIWLHAAADSTVHIVIEDDGPGVPAQNLAELGQRGLRLDRRVQGTGQGLAIVSEIVEAYGGALVIGHSERGGLRVEVRLPRLPAD
jgi:signal transduction histidine kinase